MAKITAPVKGFNGVVVGVTFTDGTAETDSEQAVNYFRRQGYTVKAGRKAGKDASTSANAKPAETTGEAEKQDADPADPGKTGATEKAGK